MFRRPRVRFNYPPARMTRRMGSYLLPRTFAYDKGRFQRDLRIHAAAIIVLATMGFLVLRADVRYMPVVYILWLSAMLVLVLMLVGPVPHLRSGHAVTGD